MTRAETRYRRMLLAYPPCWRRDHAEALLGTCLDAAAERGGRGPTTREAIDMLWLGLVWRLRLLTPSAQTRRIASALALILGTSVALTCFIEGEWQPGVAARGWRVDPGHVGPFATLGPVIYVLWLAALIAVLAGRMTAARRLLIGSVVASMIMKGPILAGWALAHFTQRVVHYGVTDDLLGLRRPPATVLALLLPLALLGCLARQAWQIWERSLIALGTAALTGKLVLQSAVYDRSPGPTDQSFLFYRHYGFAHIIDFEIYTLTPALVLVVALAWRWRPEWLSAALIVVSLGAFGIGRFQLLLVAVPELLDRTLSRAAGDNLSSTYWSLIRWSYHLASPVVLALVVAAVWWRWRNGRTRVLAG